jgi:peptidoglycan/xylan/chitin deacetylase (PgdA/CDA1 family)
LCYHDPDPATIARHLDAYSRAYTFVGLREAVDALRTRDLASLPDHPLLVTLDDGHRGNFSLLEVFRRRGVRPTIFLASGIVDTGRGFWWRSVPGGQDEIERLKALPDEQRVAALEAAGFIETATMVERTALSRDEMEALREVADLQSHTILHPILSRCTDDRAWDEISRSRSDLESAFALRVFALSYPNGTPADFGTREVEMAGRAGYTCAFTTVPGSNDGDADLFRISRIVIPDGASPDEAIVRASGLHHRLRRLLRREVG